METYRCPTCSSPISFGKIPGKPTREDQATAIQVLKESLIDLKKQAEGLRELSDEAGLFDLSAHLNKVVSEINQSEKEVGLARYDEEFLRHFGYGDTAPKAHRQSQVQTRLSAEMLEEYD